MKTLRIFTLALIASSLHLLISCSNDDEGTPVGSTITFNGTNYNMVGGLVLDYGASDPVTFGANETHYNYDFTITDADISLVGPGASATLLVYIELFSPGTSGFEIGTFNFADENTTTVEDVDGEYFFFSGEIETDTDGVEGGDLDGPEYEITGGSVTVTGSGPENYIITYNLSTDGGQLTGTYNGQWIFIDATGD